MKRLPYFVLLLLAVVNLLATPASAVTFDFVFDPDPTPGLQQPIVGTGSFTFANDPGIGTFALNSLGAFTMDFSFINGQVFTEADILSDPNQVLVVLSPFGSGRRLQFSDPGLGSGGPFSGSLDLINSQDGALSFEPSFIGEGLRLYFSDAGVEDPNAFFGDYLATNGVPDAGSTAMLMLLGLSAVAIAKRMPLCSLARIRK